MYLKVSDDSVLKFVHDAGCRLSGGLVVEGDVGGDRTAHTVHVHPTVLQHL